MQHDGPWASVMIIDDSDLDIFIAQRVLERTPGISEVMRVVGVEEALKTIEESDLPVADFVLLDVNMPLMSGFELLQLLLEKYGASFVRHNVSIMTSSESTLDEEAAKEFPIIKNYFRKPFTEQQAQTLLDVR